MTKVCLIDGSGYIFRAFYALPEMTAPDGTPVNAVYGFLTMFMRLLSNIPCDYCVVLLDAKRQNFRNEYFADYKANRAEVPEKLIPQFDLIHQAVTHLGLPYVLQEGYEADDLIATYAKIAEEKGFETVIVSADKDLMQLIRPHVSFYDGMKDKFFTPEDVKEKFGVYPDKVVDVQALAGDKTDNIPGIEGIGLKTAAELVNQFGSLQGVLDHADEIKQNKRRETVMTHKDDALTSLKLVTLKDDVPVEYQLDAFKCAAPHTEDLLQFVDKLNFKSIRPKLEKWASERGGCSATPEKKSSQTEAPVYLKIDNRTALENLYRQIKKSGQVAFQILRDNGDIRGFALSCRENSACYIPLSTATGNDLFDLTPPNELPQQIINDFLKAVLEDKTVLKIAADLKSAWHDFNKFCQKKLQLFPYDDVSVMSYVLDSTEHEHNLPALCRHFLDFPLDEPKADSKTKRIDFEAADNANYIYGGADCLIRLYPLLKQRLNTEHKNYVYEMLDRRLIEVLLKMEEEGIEVNGARLKELDEEFAKLIQTLEELIYTLAGERFNIGSPKQIGDILFGKMGIKGKKTANGNYKTGAEVLEQLADEYEIAAKILEWRMYSKLKSTYTTALLDARDKNNRVHTTFSQTVVNTGRLASSYPNLQNIPNRTEIGRKIRGCFEAKSGYKLVAADYSQMELRLMASVADVKAMKEMFNEGVDIHAATAARVFNLPYNGVDREHRSRAKAINFGIIYGMSQFGLAKQLGIPREQAKQYIDAYFAIMLEIKKYMEDTINFARQNGYVLTPMGRKCAVMTMFGKNNQKIIDERAAINAPIQGGAADIVKLAMQQIDLALQEQGYDAKLLLQVHDELVLEVKEEQAEAVAELVKNIMESAAQIDVKMIAETGIGHDWNDAH